MDGNNQCPREDNLMRYDGGTEPKEKMGKNAAVGFYRKINLEALVKGERDWEASVKEKFIILEERNLSGFVSKSYIY